MMLIAPQVLIDRNPKVPGPSIHVPIHLNSGVYLAGRALNVYFHKRVLRHGTDEGGESGKGGAPTTCVGSDEFFVRTNYLAQVCLADCI